MIALAQPLGNSNLFVPPLAQQIGINSGQHVQGRLSYGVVHKMALEVPSVISYDKLLEAIQMKLEVGEIGGDTEYLADLIITLESRIRLTHAMDAALQGKTLSVVEEPA